jgi:hypothetical protein
MLLIAVIPGMMLQAEQFEALAKKAANDID